MVIRIASFDNAYFDLDYFNTILITEEISVTDLESSSELQVKRLISVDNIKPEISTILISKPAISGIDDIKPQISVITTP